jgi:Tyrosyl-tRNA synthetase
MSGMVKSGKEARRLVNEKAVKLEGKLIHDITEKFEKGTFTDPQKLSIGKKRHFNIVVI